MLLICIRTRRSRSGPWRTHPRSYTHPHVRGDATRASGGTPTHACACYKGVSAALGTLRKGRICHRVRWQMLAFYGEPDGGTPSLREYVGPDSKAGVCRRLDSGPVRSPGTRRPALRRSLPQVAGAALAAALVRAAALRPPCPQGDKAARRRGPRCGLEWPWPDRASAVLCGNGLLAMAARCAGLRGAAPPWLSPGPPASRRTTGPIVASAGSALHSSSHPAKGWAA